LTDIELAIATQTEFEEFLRHTLDATGNSFAELIMSIKERLTRSLVDDLHYLRRERNSLAHRRKRELDSRQKFEEISSRARESLLRVAVPTLSDVGYSIPWEMNNYIVHQWSYHCGTNQHWCLRRTAENHIAIVSRYTGRCLDVERTSDSDNAAVTQWKYHGGLNQQWILTRLEDHSYQIRAAHSGKVLDIVWASDDDGATTTQYPWHGGDNQRWWIGAALKVFRFFNVTPTNLFCAAAIGLQKRRFLVVRTSKLGAIMVN
jgi:hypothetical protein